MMSKKTEKMTDDTQESTIEEAMEENAANLENGEKAALIESLQAELSQAQEKAAEYLDGWQRSRAEFNNYKKRIERDASSTYQTAAGSVIRQFLGVSDDLELALRSRPKEGEGAAWSNGVELVYRKLQSILENEGVKVIQAQGVPFDPNFHEAVLSEDNCEYESGTVIEVLQQGYLLGEKVLRPARVRVAR